MRFFDRPYQHASKPGHQIDGARISTGQFLDLLNHLFINPLMDCRREQFFVPGNQPASALRAPSPSTSKIKPPADSNRSPKPAPPRPRCNYSASTTRVRPASASVTTGLLLEKTRSNPDFEGLVGQ